MKLQQSWLEGAFHYSQNPRGKTKPHNSGNLILDSTEGPHYNKPQHRLSFRTTEPRALNRAVGSRLMGSLGPLVGFQASQAGVTTGPQGKKGHALPWHTQTPQSVLQEAFTLLSAHLRQSKPV